MSVVGRVDHFQRDHPIIGFPLAVTYKFFDDQGPYLAAIMTYYSFIAIFPLMLIATSILGFVLQDDLDLQKQLLDTALGQFPIIGDQLGVPDGITGSGTAIIIGTLAALYGSLGVGQSAQNAANVAWGVPRNSRPNPLLMRLRSLAVIAIGGAGILVVVVSQTLADNPALIGLDHLPDLGLATRLLGLLVTWVIFIVVFKMISLGRASWRSVLPGTLFCALGWQVLQYAGAAYVSRVIVRASSMNQTFALVLGLLALLFLLTSLVVIGLEINVVRRRRLYPRALLTPFTDNVQLTAGDRRAYAQYARMQRHKGFQTISIEFDNDE